MNSKEVDYAKQVSVVSFASDSHVERSTTTSSDDKETRTFLKRWIVLIIFCLLSMSNAFQWIQYSIINNIITDYYCVTSLDVNATSMVWMIVYIPLIFPATWFLDRFGLRWSVILGAFGNCLGAWIKCASASPQLFYVSFIGQTVVAISQVFILNVPPRLAAIWFGSKEVSTATSLGVFGNQLGCAIGFLVPPQIVRAPSNENITTCNYDSNDNSNITMEISSFISDATVQLEILFYGGAAATTVILLLVIIFFSSSPRVPPSLAQQASIELGIEHDYIHTLKKLLTNCNYVLLAITYGLIAGSYYSFSTLLNQTVLTYFPGEDVTVGWIGVVIVVVGMVGSVSVGVWLDCTKLFRLTLIVVYMLTFVAMLIFTLTLSLSYIWLVFVLAALLGFFMTGYLPLGYEFAIEVTHPLPEGTSSGIMNMCSQVFAISMIFLMQYFIDEMKSALGCNLVPTVALGIGAFVTVFIKADLRRKQVEHDRSQARKSIESLATVSGQSVNSTVALYS